MAMVFEPVYSVATQSSTSARTWQTWDARAGNWWFTGTHRFRRPQAVFPSYSAILAAYPNARIINWYNLADGYGVQFQAGQNSPGLRGQILTVMLTVSRLGWKPATRPSILRPRLQR